MRSSFDLTAYGKNKKAFFFWGFLFIVLGMVAIAASTFTTLVSVIFLGIVIMVSGFMLTVDAFTFWRRKGSGFVWHLLMGLLTLAVGVMLVSSPVVGSISLTLVLGVFYLVLGLLRLSFAVALRLPRWGWSLFSGLVSALLGVLILASWPASSFYIIGLFVGIDLLFCGWTYLMVGLAARSLVNNR